MDLLVGEGKRLYCEACRLARLGWTKEKIGERLQSLPAARDIDDSEIGAIAQRAKDDTDYVVDHYNHTEIGDAEFFAACNADGLRFDHTRKRWMLFDGHHWIQRKEGEIYRLEKEAMRARQVYAESVVASMGDEEDEEEQKLRIRNANWAKQGESKPRIDHLSDLARQEKAIAAAQNQWNKDIWDRDPALLGVRNGVVDLRTGVLRAGEPEDYITMVSPVDYVPEVDTIRWRQFILDVSNDDQALADYMQKVIGYCLTGDISAQQFWIFYGSGANGKSLLLGTLIQSVLPQHSKMINIPHNDVSPAVLGYNTARWSGLRLLAGSETKTATKLNTQLIKQFTGGDRIATRQIYAKPFEYDPTAKFIIAANHLPVIEDDTYAMWRRVVVVPFARRFKVDSDFEHFIKHAQSEAALLWAVEGAKRYYEEGFDAPVPDAVWDATDKLRNTIHPLRLFIDECCVREEGARVGVSMLYAALVKWYDRRAAPPQNRLSPVMFARKMEAEHSNYPKMPGHGRVEQKLLYYHGLRLKDEDPGTGGTGG